MGGSLGSVRGRSKIEAYLAYLDVAYALNSADPDPKYKKQCKREMVQDPETEEWVLHYHLRK